MTNEQAEETGFTLRDRIVALETTVMHMRDDLKTEIAQRIESNSERKVDASNLNNKIDQLEAKINGKIDASIGALSAKIEFLTVQTGEKQDRTSRLLYIGVGVAVGLNFVVMLITAFRK